MQPANLDRPSSLLGNSALYNVETGEKKCCSARDDMHCSLKWGLALKSIVLLGKLKSFQIGSCKPIGIGCSFNLFH